MKFFISITIFLMIASFSFSQTQREMNEDAKRSLEMKDKELNELYQEILDKYKDDTVFIKNLRVAQKIWIQFRDAQMDMKYPERETGYYGSIQPLCWYSYKENLTKNRIDFLNEWMKGVQEGDACSGSMQIKN